MCRSSTTRRGTVVGPPHGARALPLVALGLVTLFAPETGAASTFDHASVARKALERHIRPGYGRFADAAVELRQRIRDLCARPSEAGLARADAAFRTTVLAWGRVEHLRFGPVTERNRHERIAFWPDPKGIGRRQVARVLKRGDATVLDATSLAAKSVALQGLTAMEQVLHGRGADALASPDGRGDFRCRYAASIAHNLETIGRELVSEWSASGSFTRHWLAPGPDNPVFLDPTEVTRDLVRAYLEGLRTVGEYRIAGPLGLGSAKRRKKRAAFARSGLALPLILANVAGILDLYVAGGLADEIARGDPGLARSVRGELERVLEIGRSLDAADGRPLTDPAVTEKLILMGFPLKNAREVAGEVLAEAANTPIRFTDSDAN